MASDKTDPLGDEYFAPLVRADHVADILFYVSAALSLLALLIDRAMHPLLHDLANIAFPISVIALFASTLAIRLHFFPRAQVARLRDFVSHAFGKEMTHKKSAAYYNNSASSAPARIAAQVLESSFFSKSILSEMAFRERVQIGAYVLLWLLAVLYRQTDLAVIGIVAQVVFSEQLAARWLRLEWFRSQCEQIYDQVFEQFRSKVKFDAGPTEVLGRYEIVKATSALSVSSRIFERKREALNDEWEGIRKTLGI
jgi:hypothetical protein